jgi:hypothetical protein
MTESSKYRFSLGGYPRPRGLGHLRAEAATTQLTFFYNIECKILVQFENLYPLISDSRIDRMLNETVMRLWAISDARRKFPTTIGPNT